MSNKKEILKLEEEKNKILSNMNLLTEQELERVEEIDMLIFTLKEKDAD